MEDDELKELTQQLNDISKSVAYHISKRDKRTAKNLIQKGETIIDNLGSYTALKEMYTDVFNDLRKKIGADPRKG